MRSLRKLWMSCCVVAIGAASPAWADNPIPGAVGAFEQDYLNFILDHHYSGLRATELAAGTAVVGPTVPPGPWPANPAAFPPTPPKATDPVALEVAIRSNAAQEREINEGEMFLRDWYGYVTELNIPPAGQQLLNILEAAAPGDPFNIAFLDNFSDHHVMAIQRSAECINRAGHAALRDYCRMIVEAQARDVDEMRDQLATRYGIVGNAVPEPASWALMIAGFAAVGTALRRRQPKVAAI
jgi:hypothetical protein